MYGVDRNGKTHETATAVNEPTGPWSDEDAAIPVSSKESRVGLPVGARYAGSV